MNATSSLSELDRNLTDITDLLRGNVSKEKYKNYVSPLLFLFALETRYDREASAKKEVRYDLPEEPSISDITTASANIDQLVDRWFDEFRKLNGVDILEMRYSDETSLDDNVMQRLIARTRNIDFEHTPRDLLGEAYMNMMKRFAHEEGGEYFTPPTLSHLLARVLYTLDDGFDEDSSFHDPTAGSAGLLIETASLIRDDPDDRQPEGNITSLETVTTKYEFSGQELDPQIYKLGQMNLALHGMAGTRLRREDSLSSPQFANGDNLETFDYIVANPPFSQNWDKDRFNSGDDFQRFDWANKLPRANRADYAFLMHMDEHLSDEGMVASVIPLGVLYRNDEQTYREYLIDNDLVEAIIVLPEKLFENTTAPTAILVLNRDKPSGHEGEVLFVNADIEGKFYETSGNGRNELLDSGIREICKILSWKTKERVSRVVTNNEIRETNYNLNLSLYVDTTEPQPEIDVSTQFEKICKLKAEYDSLHDQLNEYVEQLGYE